MVRHVVCHKIKNKSDASEIGEMLKALVGVVPGLKDMEVGVDFLESARSYDLVLIATFDDREGLARYDAHPEHQKVRRFIHERRVSSVAVDYEF